VQKCIFTFYLKFIERCFSVFYLYFLEHNAFTLTAKCHFRLISNIFSLVSSVIKLNTGPPTIWGLIIIKTRVISLCHHAQTNTGVGGAPHLLSIQQRELFTLGKSVLLTQTSNLLKVKDDWTPSEEQGTFSAVGLNVTPPFIYLVLLINL